MANVKETNQWVDGIYQLEKTDDVIGGEDGIDNRQAIQLASRTTFLKNHVEDLETGKKAAGKAIKLNTARTINIDGDAEGHAEFDGSENVTMTLTQKESGIKAGSYRQVTVDAKGRVTDGNNPTTLAGYEITDAASISYVEKFEAWVQDSLSNKAGGKGIILNWDEREGQPTWLHGGNSPGNCALYNPSNFAVRHAGTAGNATNADTAQVTFKINNGADHMAFNWHDPGGQTTYVWGSDNSNSARLSATKNLRVGHADTAGNAALWCGYGYRYEENPGQIPYYVLGVTATSKGQISIYNVSNLLAGKEDRFPAGTRMPFAQAAAPTGWTQVNDDSTNNRMLRVVNGGGGGTGGDHDPVINNVVPAHTHSFTTGVESADHTHYIQDPGHVHSVPVRARGSTGAGFSDSGDRITYTGYSNAAVTGIWNSGISANHTHSGSTDNGSSQTNWQARYIDMIICAKN
ncbi:hypothetical protein [Solimicrobium silvestre]|uniref:Tail fiber protein n=1 Tax=Solimicrobium silvestre TaxID=2099400 RepID=A0A2S9GTD6_9BURK|nr:hypothetical protein [Solimicrobium silvestre]PRC90977.1 hypothetical protein S2091_4273 [Solimicrobium silvestre]